MCVPHLIGPYKSQAPGITFVVPKIKDTKVFVTANTVL